MVVRVVVPAPSFLPKNDSSGIASATSPTANKVTTVLTNLQRRNVQTFKVDSQIALSIFQMAAQGELLQLQAKLDTPGVNIDQRDDKGFSPLLWACANGQKAAVELLLFRGANPYVRGLNGESALLLAACRGHYEVVQYLLRAGLPVDTSDELENTALMFATFYNHVAIVSLLLDWGADVTAVNGEGWDALQIAVRRGSRSSQRIIEKHLVSLLTPEVHHGHQITSVIGPLT